MSNAIPEDHLTRLAWLFRLVPHKAKVTLTKDEAKIKNAKDGTVKCRVLYFCFSRLKGYRQVLLVWRGCRNVLYIGWL